MVSPRLSFPFPLQEGAEKQAQLERALREKGAVEKELEKVVSTNISIGAPFSWMRVFSSLRT